MFLVSSVLGNRQKLDGGAMFGNVPRAVWQRWCTVDEVGRIDLLCRAFLVEYEGTKLLVEAGIGAFFSPELAKRYGVVEKEHCLLASLEQLGVDPSQIDAVLLSHLHFDHAGGILSAHEEGRKSTLVFPRAQFFVSHCAWERACAPHARDRASFIPEMVELLGSSGRLSLLADGATRLPLMSDRIGLVTSHGHTPGMLIPTFYGTAQKATFCADLVPGTPWVHLPVTMGYDRFPELVIDEKATLYAGMGDSDWLLFTHDPKVAAAQLKRDGLGKFSLQQCIDHWDHRDLDQTIPGS